MNGERGSVRQYQAAGNHVVIDASRNLPRCATSQGMKSKYNTV